jgi:hypothetical protein
LFAPNSKDCGEKEKHATQEKSKQAAFGAATDLLKPLIWH